jgi:hypothetical protein
MTNAEFCVTREKHLDHMVKVVPFIVCAYAIQCYFISKVDTVDIAANGLFFLGGCLVFMITGFIIYDMTHTVTFENEKFTIEVKWLKYSKTFTYFDITNVEISEAGQSFATLTLTTKDGKKMGFYFVDEADKIKTWLEQKRIPQLRSAA